MEQIIAEETEKKNALKAYDLFEELETAQRF
jgi:hypothetical protein